MNSNKLKEEGNKLFLKRNYKEAIELYSKAIEKSSNICIYFTNRALCYLKLQQYTNVIEDCKRAIEIDCRSVKAHFYLGQALVELHNYDDAIIYLKRAHELTKELHENYGDEITRSIRNAKKRRWNEIEEKRIKNEIELQKYLQRLMYEDKMRRINEIKTKKYGSTSNSHDEDTGSMDMDDGNNETSSFKSVKAGSFENNLNTVSDEATLVKDVEQEYDVHVNELNRLFEENDERRRKRDIPDYLCGKISFELMTEPVITPYGITYDRNDIEQHLQRVGHFDPVTRQELNIDQLIPNLIMKEVIENFVTSNPWVDGAY